MSPPASTKISVRYGDITELEIECIVNASNETGLGCFTPNHPCIDNAIHKKAGPELLEECKTLNGVPEGVAKITNGYRLPAKYIIHVTGPKVSNLSSHLSNPEDHTVLAKCYVNCLELAKKHKIRSMAFCCISTGMYGYDKTKASQTAYDTVTQWLLKNPDSFDLIVFNVFNDQDDLLYRNLINKESESKSDSMGTYIYLILIVILLFIIFLFSDKICKQFKTIQ